MSEKMMQLTANFDVLVAKREAEDPINYVQFMV